MKDYTWRCDCANGIVDYDSRGEGSTKTLSQAKKEAKEHLKVHTKIPYVVFIDEYDIKAGELSGRYWKVSNM